MCYEPLKGGKGERRVCGRERSHQGQLMRLGQAARAADTCMGLQLPHQYDFHTFHTWKGDGSSRALAEGSTPSSCSKGRNGSPCVNLTVKCGGKGGQGPPQCVKQRKRQGPNAWARWEVKIASQTYTYMIYPPGSSCSCCAMPRCTPNPKPSPPLFTPPLPLPGAHHTLEPPPSPFTWQLLLLLRLNPTPPLCTHHPQAHSPGSSSSCTMSEAMGA